MYEWKRNGNYKSVEDFFRGQGLDPEQLVNPSPVPARTIEGIPQAAKLIYDYTNNRRGPIWIIGDYDADGITATAILMLMFLYVGFTPVPIIPRRFTDGYGISDAMIAGIQDGLVIIVDNGISEIERVRKLKMAGNKVIILDHHLPSDTLPPADVLVDPHIHPENNGFCHYCGAGLAYKLAEYLFANDSRQETARLLMNLTCLATIGTVADVMPLIGDNRVIVKKGLEYLAAWDKVGLYPGLFYLVYDELGERVITEETIKFSFAPVINAPGRLEDCGGECVLHALIGFAAKQAAFWTSLASDTVDVTEGIRYMFSMNEQRKTMTDIAMQKIKAQIASNPDMIHDGLAILNLGNKFPEGLTGLLAGRIAEEYHCVTFVFIQSQEQSSVLKGSARTYRGYDISGMLPVIKSIALSAGGHTGAAGVSVSADRFEELKDALYAYVKDYPVARDEQIKLQYDIVFDMMEPGAASQIQDAVAALKKYAPFGEGVPCPTFCVMNFIGDFRRIGKNGVHIKGTNPALDVIGFRFGAEMSALTYYPGVPIDLIGSLSENHFRGMITTQMNFTDFHAPIDLTAEDSLLA